jgi:hypothetical protein
LQGNDSSKVINRDAMANPESLDWFVDFQASRGRPAI